MKFVSIYILENYIKNEYGFSWHIFRLRDIGPVYLVTLFR